MVERGSLQFNFAETNLQWLVCKNSQLQTTFIPPPPPYLGLALELEQTSAILSGLNVVESWGGGGEYRFIKQTPPPPLINSLDKTYAVPHKPWD